MRSYRKKVSVIMGIYNQWDENALIHAVNSILNQSLEDFEFIIYDDGSTQEVAQRILKLADLDKRIIIIGKSINRGLGYSLNRCIEKATGEYIARMDADDISMSCRLEKQIAFLDAHPEYMWCGCNAILFDENEIYGERKMPEVPSKSDYLKYSPFIHPSVVYRATIFEKMNGYCESKETLRCEDYEFFMRLNSAGHRGYNIQETLFWYRENRDSFKRRDVFSRINEAKIRYQNFKAMGILLPKGWVYVFRPILAGFVPHRILLWIKRNEAKPYHENKSKDGVLQTHITRETYL